MYDLVSKYIFPHFLSVKLYFNFHFRDFQHFIVKFQWFVITPKSLHNSIFLITPILQIIIKICTKTSHIELNFAHEHAYIMYEIK